MALRGTASWAHPAQHTPQSCCCCWLSCALKGDYSNKPLCDLPALIFFSILETLLMTKVADACPVIHLAFWTTRQLAADGSITEPNPGGGLKCACTWVKPGQAGRF